MIFPAMKTGRLRIITGAMARELITNDAGRVMAISYVDKGTRTEKQIRCRAAVIAASACESARLLLNSRSPRFPNGVANESGMVGRNLTDTTGYSLAGHIPAMANLPRHNSDGIGGMHVYIPWWLLDDKKKDFPRGYHIEVGGGFRMPQIGSYHGLASAHEGYGSALKTHIRENYGAWVSFAGRGEMIPNANSFCEIDSNTVDQWGIPVLRFHFRWSEHEIKQIHHMHNTFTALIETMGGKPSARKPMERAADEVSIGGEIIHEAGTIRMSDDPQSGPLNRWCQAHHVKNLFVADAAPFLGNPDKNVTLSIVALAWRTAEYLAEEMRKGNV
jgi:choline dehydrogenase-like flavoprotein